MTIVIIGIVTTACIGISSQIFKQLDNAFFDSECENILTIVHHTRDSALMSGHQRWIRFTENRLDYQDPIGDNYSRSKSLRLSHTTVKSDMPQTNYNGRQIYFSIMGTVETGATFKLYSRSGRYRYLVIQPVTGRIYLTP